KGNRTKANYQRLTLSRRSARPEKKPKHLNRIRVKGLADNPQGKPADARLVPACSTVNGSRGPSRGRDGGKPGLRQHLSGRPGCADSEPSGHSPGTRRFGRVEMWRGKR